MPGGPHEGRPAAARLTPPDLRLSAADFRALYQRVRALAPWAADDRRGALNYLTPQRIAAAASSVRDGRTVSLAAPVEGEAAADNPEPWVDDLTHPAARPGSRRGLDFAMDTLFLHVHGNADSHLDALCHVSYDGVLYNGVAPDPGNLSVDLAGQGIAGRGVLLDIPRLRGVEWLEPGDHVTVEDVTRAEEAQHISVGPGDLLFIRVGHRRRRNQLGPWDAAASRAGLHPSVLELLGERQIAILGSDSNNDTAPSAAEGVDFPVHVLALPALGLMLLDYLQFEDLVSVCESAGRWSFLCVIAPLRLPDGTGSPVNPIAIF
jgi:kynurenine formamidase